MFARSFVVKGLEKCTQAVFLSGDEGSAFVAGHVWRNEVATGAEVFCLCVAGARGSCWAGGLSHHVAEHGDEIVGAGSRLCGSGTSVAFRTG